MGKFINIKQNEWQKLNQFKQFESVQEMNDHIQLHSKQLNKGQISFLQLISRYSCFSGRIGVCWRKKDELSKEIQKCPRTIIRYTKQLIEKGIIKVVKTLKANGRQGANIYIIQKSIENVTPKSPTNHAKNKRMSLLVKAESKIIKSIRKEESVPIFDHSFLPSHIPDEFVKATKSFFNAATIYTLWGKVLLAAKIARIDDVNSLIGVITQQLKATVFMIKKNRVRDLNAYFYSGIYQVFIQYKRKQNYRGLSWLISQ